MAYQEINEVFQHYAIETPPAEAHGIATALLCVDIQATVDNWLAQLFEEEIAFDEDDKATLIASFERTRTLLNPDKTGFEFDLLLPENTDLQDLALSLSEWCQGFLWGIGYAHSEGNWSGETQGILKDMVEITKLDPDIQTENDDDEEAFMQLHEYLRAAVLIIRDELSDLASTTTH